MIESWLTEVLHGPDIECHAIKFAQNLSEMGFLLLFKNSVLIDITVLINTVKTCESRRFDN